LIARAKDNDEVDASNDGLYGSDEMSEEELKAALREAAELFDASSTISRLQVQQELEQSFAADMPSLEGASYTSSSQANSDMNGTLPALSYDAALSFWVEQGLSKNAAARLLREIDASGRSYTLQQLTSKVQRWQRVLPDVDIATLASKDFQLLDADINRALLNMITLVELFPGRDIVSLLVRQPRLLWCEDLGGRTRRVITKLASLHPSKEEEVVRDIVVENPELIYRMDYYMGAVLMDDLPIEIQNMMIVADQGIGFLYRYYRNRATNYRAETYQNNFPPQE